MQWTSREWIVVAALVVAVWLAPLAGGVGHGTTTNTAQEDEELEALLVLEREQADFLRRRGSWAEARSALDALIAEATEEGEVDLAARALRARLEWDEGRFDEALREAAAVIDSPGAAQGPGAAGLARAFEVRFGVLSELGRTRGHTELVAELEERGFRSGADATVDVQVARFLFEAGRRDDAITRLRGATSAPGTDWRTLLAKGVAARELGDLVGASQLLVRAATVAEREPEVLAQIASLYIEADGEVESAAAADRNPGPLLREARQTNPRSEVALLTLAELYRLNWRRSHFEADGLLRELLAARPTSIDGHLAAAEQELLLGDLKAAHARLVRLQSIAPGRRAVRILEASLVAIDDGPDAAEGLLEVLIAEDPRDSTPQRVVGTRLVELYRFVEGRAVLDRAVERNAEDWRAWTVLGRARANTGDVSGARSALARAKDAARLRQDVVRWNLTRVLEIVDEEFVLHREGELTFAWRERGADLLELYFVPFYAAARAELSARYGYSTGPVRIEVFDRHRDFSVRSTGFEGFPALGVCFGPVVTAVSPLSELRGGFSWARTGYHEFTHVVHLGLSRNRCPRWVTEGLATWEEVEKRSSWTRNMRSDLVDARANGQIFDVRDLNAAFRGPRVIFGYYQGGLLCDMLIARHGFPSMLRLLAQFDSGADLDTALREVFDTTPEELDVDFARYVDAELANIALEPNWDLERLKSRWLILPRTAPTGDAEREQWQSDWLDLAFAAWQSERRPDAEEALRIVGSAPPLPPRALFLRAQLALADGDRAAGRRLLTEFFERGGDDFRARLALAEMARAADDMEEAEKQLVHAERAFPGHPDAAVAAELALAKLFDAAGRNDEAMAARQRWIASNADDWNVRMDLARWHVGKGRHAEAVALFEEVNEVEPFQRGLHLAWARSLLALERHDEVLRETTAYGLVPVDLDAVAKEPASERERAEVSTLRARALIGLNRMEEGRAEAERARELAPSAPFVRALWEELDA